MPRKKQITPLAKVMTYQIKQDVMNAIECIQKREPGLNTIHKVIDYCILNHDRLVELLRKEESEALKLHRSKIAIETELTKLAQFQSFLQKHTKIS
jgi:hypothetical protein